MGTADPPTIVDARADDALGDSDASDLRDRLARREVSPAELREAARSRARRADLRLNAVTGWVDRTPPRGSAVPGPRQSGIGQSGISSALAGIPTALKDNEALAGYPMSNGSLAMPSTPSPQSSPIIGLLLDLGLEPIALTTLPEFGLTASTESTRYGATRNPWDLRRSAGGSSGGSAALVAAGVVPLAHANDGGGSTRIPAACCGLVGLKPSRGRLPDAPGTRVLPVQITAQGVLTRSVRDTALFYAAAEARHPVPGLRPIGQVTRPGPARLRIGVCTTASRNLPVSPDTVAAVEATARLCQDLGHDLVPVDPPVGDDFGPDFLVYWALLSALVSYGGPRLYGPGFDRSRVEEFTHGMSARLLRDPTRAVGAVRRLTRLAREHETAFADYDVLLCPVTGHPAPVLGRLGPTTPFAEHLVRLMRFASMTPVQNVSGSPAISLPLGRSAEGLPIGVQLAAPFGFERRLLQLALALEEAAPWPTHPVPPGQAG